MNDRAVLEFVRAPIRIYSHRANDRAKPDTRVFTDLDIANHDSIVGDKRGFVDLWMNIVNV